MVSLLTSAPWKFSKMEADGNDVSSAVSACAQDNTITFHASFDGEVKESNNVCAPSYAKNFFWGLTENNTKLDVSSIIFPGGQPEFTIVSASETTLVLRQVTTLIPGPSEVIVTITLVH